MRRKGTHIRTSEYMPSRAAISILVGLLVIAIGAFAYYCYQLVERHTAGQQLAPAAPITTPEPQASATVATSKQRVPQAYVQSSTPEPQGFVASEPITTPPASVQYRCDGRTRCSQMTSC